MTARAFFALLAALIFTGWGTAFAANHANRGPDFRGSPQASQHRQAAPNKPTAPPQQHQQQQQQQQQQDPDAADPVDKSNGKASPVAGAATEHAGEGTGTADAVKDAIEEKNGQGLPDESGQDTETPPELPEESNENAQENVQQQ